MKTNKELTKEFIENVKKLLEKTDILEITVHNNLHISRGIKILELVKEEINILSLTDGNIFYKDLDNGNMLLSKNIKYLNYNI